jgi:DNA gyrase/topoisomerase IV subunit A
VVERRARFNLAKANKRLHLVEGFLVALTDLDQIVKTIRAANDGIQQPSGHPVCLIV